MKRRISAALLSPLLLIAGALHAERYGDTGTGGRSITPVGNPSALIAAELAFARLARDKGQWTAFDQTATDDAEMFVPARTLAKPWLKKRTNPPQALQWQPHAAWIACDGSAGVTYGAYQAPGGTQGWFSTVWQRGKKGDYKWSLDQGGELPKPLAAPDWSEGKVADCPARPRSAGDDASRKGRKPADTAIQRTLAGPIPALDPTGLDSKDGQSRDGSLAWRSTVRADGTRAWTVWLWKDGEMAEVLSRTASDG